MRVEMERQAGLHGQVGRICQDGELEFILQVMGHHGGS